jgi:hypothetical protein
MYNSTRLHDKQEQTEQWIIEHFPAMWEEMVKHGKARKEDSSLSKINIEIELKP